jgi:tetratricopeptide (TPR) repeat protein
VRKVGRRLRITARLNNAPDGYQIWSETYDRELKEVFAIQEEIVTAIVKVLRGKISAQGNAIPADPTKNLGAYNLYFLGRYHLNRRGNEGELKQAIKYLEKAVQQDPNYGSAYAELGQCYFQLAVWDFLPPRAAVPKARENLSKALKLDSGLVSARATSAAIAAAYDYRPRDAAEEVRSLTAAFPNVPRLHLLSGVLLEAEGRTAEALAELRKAEELDPLDIGVGGDLARLYLQAGDHDRAIGQLNRMLELDPNSMRIHLYLAEAHERQHKHAEAIAVLEKARSLRPDYSRLLGWLGYTYAAGGRVADARRVLEQLQVLCAKRYVPAYQFALVHLGLGQKDSVFDWLEKACDERYALYLQFMGNHVWEAVHGDSRFAAILRRIGWAD